MPFAVPSADERRERLASVLEVLYLIFNEGYSATAGEDWMRPALLEEALRLGRVLAELAPEEPEAHGLVALMELQASRRAARTGRGRRADPARRPGPGPLGPAADPPRARGARDGRVARPPGGPVHAPGRDRRLPRARRDARGDGLGADRRALRGARPRRRLAGRRAQPRRGPRDGLRPRGRACSRSTRSPPTARSTRYHLLPSVRGDLLARLGRTDEARAEFERAASLTRNGRERALLLGRAAACT